MHFTKMEGLGNDYLYYFGELEDPEGISIRYSDRHFGIGSDGIILISKSEVADFKMRIFNADGSEAMMCGNGIRCVGKYVYDKGYTTKTKIDVETLSGIKNLDLKVEDGKVVAASVNMGTVKVSESVEIKALDSRVVLTPANVGNPHAVIITDDAENAPLTTLGKAIEHHTHFPGGVNVEFITLTGENELRMRVWERGSGITMACGTGACAAASVAVKAGLCEAGKDITVKLDGGDLKINVSPEWQVQMTGPATLVAECDV